MVVLNVSGASQCGTFTQRPIQHEDGDPYYFYKSGTSKYLSFDDQGMAREIDFSSETTLNATTPSTGPDAYTPRYGDFKIKLKWNGDIKYGTQSTGLVRYLTSSRKTDGGTDKIVGFLSTPEDLSKIRVKVVIPKSSATTASSYSSTETEYTLTSIPETGIRVTDTTASVPFYMVNDSSYDAVGKPKYVLDMDGNPHDVNTGMPDFSKIVQYRYSSCFTGNDDSVKIISFVTIPRNITGYYFTSSPGHTPNDPRSLQGLTSDQAPNRNYLRYDYTFTVGGTTYKVVEGAQASEYAKPDPESFSRSDLSTITLQYVESVGTSIIPSSTSITGFQDINTDAGTGIDKTVFNPFTQLASYISPQPTAKTASTLIGNRGSIYSIENTSTSKTCIISSLGHYLRAGQYDITSPIGYAYFISDTEFVVNILNQTGVTRATVDNPLDGTHLRNIPGFTEALTDFKFGSVTPAATDDIINSTSLTNPTRPKVLISDDIEIPPGKFLVILAYNMNTTNATLLRCTPSNTSSNWYDYNISIASFSGGDGELKLRPGPSLKWQWEKTFTASAKTDINTTLANVSVEGQPRIPMFSFRYKIKTTTDRREVSVAGSGPVRFLGIEGTNMVAKAYYAHANTADANFNTYDISEPGSSNAVFLLLLYNGNKIITVTAAGALTITSDATISSIVNSSTASSTGTVAAQGGWSFTTDGYLYYTAAATATASKYLFLTKPTGTSTAFTFTSLGSPTPDPASTVNFARVRCFHCSTDMSMCKV